jgi:hypothetical protein
MLGKQRNTCGEDKIPEIFATIQIRIFYRPFSYLHSEILKHNSIILPVVLHGCETWSLTSMEDV